MTSIMRHLRVRARLFGSCLAALAAFILMPRALPVPASTLAAWDLGVAIYLATAGWAMSRASIEAMKKRADREYEGATTVLVLAVCAALASLVAIGAELHGIRSAAPKEEEWKLLLTGFTILCSWFFLHVIFATHYAHVFYADAEGRRSLDFPAESRPDYLDFLYFSFTIGAAAQTSDVAVISRRMRRIVLGHTVLSFLFNTTVLALAINVAAGAL